MLETAPGLAETTEDLVHSAVSAGLVAVSFVVVLDFLVVLEGLVVVASQQP